MNPLMVPPRETLGGATGSSTSPQRGEVEDEERVRPCQMDTVIGCVYQETLTRANASVPVHERVVSVAPVMPVLVPAAAMTIRAHAWASDAGSWCDSSMPSRRHTLGKSFGFWFQVRRAS